MLVSENCLVWNPPQKAPSQERHGVLRVASLQCTGPKQGYSDIFELTPASRVTPSHTVVWRVELACTGASLYGKPPPNCQRPCCAGFGVCYEGCKGGSRYGCSVKVVIEASKAASGTRADAARARRARGGGEAAAGRAGGCAAAAATARRRRAGRDHSASRGHARCGAHQGVTREGSGGGRAREGQGE